MKKERKIELVNKYMTKKIPALTEYQKEWIRKETAHYIFVDRDDDGKHHCHCDRCNKEVDLGKTKHNSKVICPSCGKEFEVIHKWRIKNLSYKETIDWVAIPKVIDQTTLMLRYICAHRNGLHLHIFEGARLVINTQRKSVYYFENRLNGWEYSRMYYFAEYNMYNYRQWCCLPAKKYIPTWTRELKRFDCFKYFPEFMEYVDKYYYLSSGLRFISYKAPLYEKLKKAGFEDFVKNDFERVGKNSFGINYNVKEKSLLKMIGLNKNQFNILRNNQDIESYELIREFPDITQNYLDLLRKAKLCASAIAEIKNNKYNINKTIKYITKNNINYYEWKHYLINLEALGYQLDESYMYPKDFRKEDARVAREYSEEMERRRQREREENRMMLEKKEKECNQLIINISNALRNNKELMQFFAGSNGLQVFVPENANDLRNEGRYLHNCLGTYVDRVANGKTLIFFIRRIEDPTAPYIAMEYCHGKVVQVRYDYNKTVDDEKIINFVDALAATLVKQNILAA